MNYIGGHAEITAREGEPQAVKIDGVEIPHVKEAHVAVKGGVLMEIAVTIYVNKLTTVEKGPDLTNHYPV